MKINTQSATPTARKTCLLYFNEYGASYSNTSVFDLVF